MAEKQININEKVKVKENKNKNKDADDNETQIDPFEDYIDPQLKELLIELLPYLLYFSLFAYILKIK